MATVTGAERGDRTRCSEARKGQQKPHLAKVQSARHEKEHFSSRRSQLDCRGTSLLTLGLSRPVHQLHLSIELRPFSS